MQSRRLIFPALLAGLSAALPAGGCGSDKPMEPPPDPSTSAVYQISDPCTAKAPLPNNLFVDDTGVDERAACAPPSDPIEAAIVAALSDEGAPIDSKILIPFEGTGLDLNTLTASAALSLTDTATVIPGAPIPPTIVLAAPTTSTQAKDYRLLGHTATVDGNDQVEILLEQPLVEGWYYVVVTTDAIKDQARPQRVLAQSPAVKALTGFDTVVAGAYEGLDEAGAMRLERERQRLAPIVAILAAANPPIINGKIRSIQAFSTALGFKRLERVTEAYHDAVTAGRITYNVQSMGGEIAPADVYPQGTPASAFAQVNAFRRGTIRVPRLLGEDGYLRTDWATNIQTIGVPFLVSLPRGGGGYRAAIYLPGFLRSKLDARELANAFAGAPRAAVMGIDLRCHGDRALDASGQCKDERSAAEIMALVDANSNGNPERTGADGVPDNSGAGFFNGDPRKLRDTQLAAIIEVMHIISTFQRGSAALMQAGIVASSNDVHVIAHGHSAPIAVAAASLTRAPVRTLMLPSGGATTEQLVLDGPAPLKDHFMSTLPAGVTAAMAPMYLARLEQTVLKALSITATGMIANDRYIRSAPSAPRILIAHGDIGEFVSVDARTALINAVGLDRHPTRVSNHHGRCDDFYLHTCILGDNIAWGERAREQLASYLASGGVTVLSPAQ